MPANVSCEEVTLETSLRPGKSMTLETYSALVHQLKPKPRAITQSDNQRVLLTAAQHTLSPYPIATQSPLRYGQLHPMRDIPLTVEHSAATTGCVGTSQCQSYGPSWRPMTCTCFLVGPGTPSRHIPICTQTAEA